jgi:anhydro-N-acetylmuramic acid kinase
MSDLYIGLMSGTSADGIDAALLDFSEAKPVMIGTHFTPYSDILRQKIMALYQQGENEIERMGELDRLLAKAFAQATHALLMKCNIPAKAIQAIGSHGQTIRHQPHHPERFTVQIGDPNTLAAETGIITVADFRRKDIAYGGQGAPLVPAFHQHVFSSSQAHRAIVNIGGIANVTLLPHHPQGAVLGFDTGPGNALIDAWIHRHQQERHDAEGRWGAQGKVQQALLTRLLNDAYFSLPPPKSTGREHFHLAWLQQHLQSLPDVIAPIDIQATLVELTAQSIITAILSHFQSGDILVCGGGVHNAFLMSRLQSLASPHFKVGSTQHYGIHPDWVEAAAFAWLARQTLNHAPGNLPSVTGATQAIALGGIYYPA